MISRLHLWLKRLRVRRKGASLIHGVSRVEWDVAGSAVWFESADVSLSEEPEAVACLCFAAANLGGWKVRFPLPVCGMMKGNLSRLSRIWNRWWSTGERRFLSKRRKLELKRTTCGDIAVFLSLGVDSFYSLLRYPDANHIVYVAGFDVKLHDSSRLERIERSLRQVGEARGMRVTVVRTNLREHPVFRTLSWERFHGAALAAVGYLLADSIQRIVISSSYPREFFKPWGSSWKTDHLWSSKVLEVAHFGEELWRFGKLEAIADDPLVRAHLRICWEHRNDDLNCGSCEKCLRTMLGLLSVGKLSLYPTFPDEATLLENLRKTRRIHDYLIPTYRGFIKRGLPPEAEKVVRQLIRRSKPAAEKAND